MKVLLLCILLIPLCMPSPCKIFKCGSIEQTSGEEVKCVDLKDTSDYKADQCTANQHCESRAWTTVAEASLARCRANAAQEVQGFAAPGDYCSDAKFCAGYTAERSCEKNVCTAKNQEGDGCPDVQGNPGHKWCPLGTYCDANAKCAKQVGKDEVCEVGEKCQFGYVCAATNTDFDDYRCFERNTLENNKQFDISRYLHGGNIWVGYSSMCASYHAIEVPNELSRLECRPGDKSTGMSSLNDYRRDGDGEDCPYETFSSTSKTELEAPSDKSICGFNTDTNGYCIMRKGDDWFLDQHKQFVGYDVTKLNCHPQSSITNCTSVLNMDEDIRINWVRANLAVDPDFGYHLYAGNDRCVAETITPAFWQGRDPDSAVYTTMWSTLAVAIITILHLV